MSNRMFLAVVGTIIAVLLGFMAVQKWQDCAEQGGKACPMPRVPSHQPSNGGGHNTPSD
jgi:hypothetical protein